VDALVSICIPVFNREDLILDAIKSAQNQTISNIEIVVVDNASTDETFRRVYEESIKDKRIKLYKNSENIGALRNFYKAIELASAQYVVLLGSDDWLETDFVQCRLNGFDLHPEVAFVSGPMKVYEQISATEIILKARYIYQSRTLSYEEIINLFYRKFLISYFCMFKKCDMLNNFHFNYDDPYKWGVYEKGLGLDLINCLSIIENSVSQSIYYSEKGCYCFRNHAKRESEEITSQDKGLDKTITDFTYNTFIFKDYIKRRSVPAAKIFLDYKFLELSYEILRSMLAGKKIDKNTIHLLKQYININSIQSTTIVMTLLIMPFYIFQRFLYYGKRKFL
jgi:glycosyltransferase involved in cell wall biosynthesis